MLCRPSMVCDLSGTIFSAHGDYRSSRTWQHDHSSSVRAGCATSCAANIAAIVATRRRPARSTASACSSSPGRWFWSLLPKQQWPACRGERNQNTDIAFLCEKSRFRIAPAAQAFPERRHYSCRSVRGTTALQLCTNSDPHPALRDIAELWAMDGGVAEEDGRSAVKRRARSAVPFPP